MSYLVVALGVFLSLCGAFWVYEGYGIIQVERGWAMVIAGSVVFSCGVVTLALGLILHRLTGLHALVKSAQGWTSPLREQASGMPRDPQGESALSFTSEPSISDVPPLAAAPSPAISPGVSPRSWPQRPMRSNLAAARNFLKLRKTVWPSARGSKKSPLSRDSLKNAQTEVELPSEPDFDLPAEITVAKAKEETETRIAFTAAEEAPAGFAWRTDAERDLFDEAATEQTEEFPIRQRLPEPQDKNRGPQLLSETEAIGPAGRPSIEATFKEELFIAIDTAAEPQNETAASPSLRSPERTSPDFAPSARSEAATAAGPEAPSEPSPPVSRASLEGLAIVGQYESGETSYVMYSDGSIEARTQHAVFHFKSMAELKAFMESEAQNLQE